MNGWVESKRIHRTNRNCPRGRYSGRCGVTDIESNVFLVGRRWRVGVKTLEDGRLSVAAIMSYAYCQFILRRDHNAMLAYSGLLTQSRYVVSIWFSIVYLRIRRRKIGLHSDLTLYPLIYDTVLSVLMAIDYSMPARRIIYDYGNSICSRTG